MSKIKCEICGAETHIIVTHLKSDHPDVSPDEYHAKFPDAPMLSDMAAQKIAERTGAAQPGATQVPAAAISENRKPLHELFGLNAADKSALNRRGDAVLVSVLPDGGDKGMVPEIDPNYVFDGEMLRNALMAYELNLQLYVWGHAGTGKTQLHEQICARTNRPMIRVQHSANTEESHILGQWTARGGETIFECGPLADAMKNGWVYLADEYDFALPSVLAVYQPVLEGKPLVIKEADAANRVIKPHPNFRFVATGNTNGTGDETGLYQGTNIQNAANYDRFRMVFEVRYMPPDKETQILVKQGGIAASDAERMVDFANRVRAEYSNAKISAPISPRTLIAASRIGMMKGNYRDGLQLCFSNKLSRVDKEIVDSVAARIFG
ncbi:MoxR family ATPase [Castellaniella sp.]|uniref:MoxR family ATPase n=1 Tax=Castellaniella sp. TaxID=1955812 RepID=UPI002AFF65BD|nr:MoxR family ATPase [Castellaniella sp.]